MIDAGYSPLTIQLVAELRALNVFSSSYASLMTQKFAETPSRSYEGPMTNKFFQRLRRGFEEAYIDPYDTARNIVCDLRNGLDDYCRRPMAYIAPYTSLVTSSMMGKSRLMKEMARHVPTVYICFREPGVSGYPQSTPTLPQWINSSLDNITGTDKDDKENILPTTKFCVFFLVLLKNLARIVREHYATTSSQQSQGEYNKLDFSWMWDFFAEPSEGSSDLDNFCEKVVKDANKIADSIMDSRAGQGVAKAARDYLRGDWCVLLAAEYSELMAAFKVAKGSEEEKDFMLLLVCDEARTLCNVSAKTGGRIPFSSPFNDRCADIDPDPGTIERPYSNFRAFRRALRYLQMAFLKSPKNIGQDTGSTLPLPKEFEASSSFPRVFGLLTDTSSRLANFQPAPWLDERSLRDMGFPPPGHEQFAPLSTFTSIDVHSKILKPMCVSDIKSVANPNRLLRLGRAGWFSVLSQQNDNDPVAFAETKLVCNTNRFLPFAKSNYSDRNRLALLAILAPRLDVTAGPTSHEASELVASHLAVLMSTDENRHVLRTTYLSEPILAEASANLTSVNGWGQPLRALSDYVKCGIVDGGFRGELLTKILCLMAMDQAQPKTFDVLSSWRFSRPVKVSHFLEALIPPSQGKTIIERIHATPLNDQRLDNFLNGYIFFNHFTRCQDILTIPKLVQAWNRGAALMCKPCTPGIDHVIPVMLPGEATEFGPLHKASWDDAQIERARKRVSYILINSKNYTTAKNWNRSVLDIKADESNIVSSLPLEEIDRSTESLKDLKGKNNKLVLVLLQDFGPKHKKEGYVNLVPSKGPKRPLDDDSQLYIILKELHPKTYKCLAASKGDDLVFESLEALRLAQVPYFADLSPTDELGIARRTELLPLKIDSTPSMERAWDLFLERPNEDETDEMDVEDEVETSELGMDESDENIWDECDEGNESNAGSYMSTDH